MQTLKERYAIKRLNKAQKKIINERVRRLQKQLTLLETTLLSEGGPTKETLESAMALLKRLDQIAAETKLDPLKAAVEAIRAQISTKFKETGSVKNLLRGLASDVVKSLPGGKELFTHNPIGYGIKFMKSLIGGFSKLNDVVEVHGAQPTQQKEPAKQEPAPQTEAEEKSAVGIPEKDPFAPSSQPDKTPVEKTDKTAAQQPTTNAQPDEKQGSLAAALVAANPKYKQNMGNIITDLFDLGDYKKIVGDGKDFVKAVLDLDMNEIPRIQQAFSQMQADIDTAAKALNAQQQGQQQQQTQDQGAQATQGDVDINDQNVQAQTKKLADQVANQLTNNKMNLKFPDTMSDDLVKFILSKVANQKAAQPAAAEPAKPAAQPAKQAGKGKKGGAI